MKSKHKCDLLRDSISHLPKLLPNESAISKLRRSVRKLFLVSIDHPEVIFYLKSSTAIEKESKRQVDLKVHVIHPLSIFRKYWNILIFCTVFLHQFLTAFTIGFFMELPQSTVQLIFVTDAILCLILWIEIILSFRTGYIVVETNEIILQPQPIAKKYVKNFIPDALTSFPYILIIVWIHYTENNHMLDIEAVVAMVLIFLLSIYRFAKFYSYFSSIPNLWNLSEKTCIIFRTCLRSFFLLHWTACIRKLILYYVEQHPMSYENNEFKEARQLSKFYIRRMDFSDNNIRIMRRMEKVLEDDENIFKEIYSNYTVINKYTRALMLTLKLYLQTGYGSETSDSIVNMLLTSLIIFAGWIYTTCVLISISNIIFASAVSKNKFQEILNDINVFSEAKGLSGQLRDKMKTYVEKKFQKRFFNEDAINMYVQSTAACLKKEIMMHSCSHLLTRVPIFKDLPKSLLENIISCLKFEIYFPNEIIIEANTIGDSMYFIAYGTADVISTTGHKIQTLQDGSYFGEISLLIKGQKRTATIKSLETCEVYRLSQRDFRKVIEPHNDVVKRMEEIAKERIRKMYQTETGSVLDQRNSAKPR